MIDYSKARIQKFHCKFCHKDVEFQVPFGCFILQDEDKTTETMCSLDLIQERPGKNDSLVQELHCDSCGCCSGLREIQ